VGVSGQPDCPLASDAQQGIEPMNRVMINPHLGPVLGGIQKDTLCLAREFVGQVDQVAFGTTFSKFPQGAVGLSR
jgi:hypothetical protein